MLSFVAQVALCAAVILITSVCMRAQREYVAEEVEKLKATDGGRNSRKSIGPGLCVNANAHTCRGRERERGGGEEMRTVCCSRKQTP